VVLLFSLSVVNTYGYTTARVSSVVTYWAQRPNPVLCAAAMLLFHNMQRITLSNFFIFRKSMTLYHCMVLIKVAVVLIPPQTFVRRYAVLVLPIVGNWKVRLQDRFH
jgi:hypothetical protein